MHINELSMLGMGHRFLTMLASTCGMWDWQGVMALDGILILQDSVISEKVPDEAVLVKVHH